MFSHGGHNGFENFLFAAVINESFGHRLGGHGRNRIEVLVARNKHGSVADGFSNIFAKAFRDQMPHKIPAQHQIADVAHAEGNIMNLSRENGPEVFLSVFSPCFYFDSLNTFNLFQVSEDALFRAFQTSGEFR